MQKTSLKGHIINQKVGRNLANLRQARNISRKQLAQFLNVSTISIYKYETGDTAIPTQRLVCLMHFLNCKPDDVFFGVL